MAATLVIVGQGLAGTLLGLALEARGVEFEIWDPGQINASQVAAGLIVPVGGRRWTKRPEVERLLPFAVQRYRELEARWGQKLLHPIKRLRLFRSDKERELVLRRHDDPAYRPYLGEIVAPGEAGFDLRDGFGGIWLRECYWLDTQTLLQEARRRWREAGRFRRGIFQDTPKATVIFCEGWRVVHNPYFSRLPWRLAFGEILTLRAESLPPFMVQREKWLLPVGEGRYRLGSTYRHRFDRVEPTAGGRQELLAGLRALFKREVSFEIEEERADVRIKAQDQRPVLGSHPSRSEILILNGFGSHGALQIPYYAERLVRDLLKEERLPPEVDLIRFLG